MGYAAAALCGKGAGRGPSFRDGTDAPSPNNQGCPSASLRQERELCHNSRELHTHPGAYF